MTMVSFKSLLLKTFPLNEAMFSLNGGVLQSSNIKQESIS